MIARSVSCSIKQAGASARCPWRASRADEGFSKTARREKCWTRRFLCPKPQIHKAAERGDDKVHPFGEEQQQMPLQEKNIGWTLFPMKRLSKATHLEYIQPHRPKSRPEGADRPLMS